MKVEAFCPCFCQIGRESYTASTVCCSSITSKHQSPCHQCWKGSHREEHICTFFDVEVLWEGGRHYWWIRTCNQCARREAKNPLDKVSLFVEVALVEGVLFLPESSRHRDRQLRGSQGEAGSWHVQLCSSKGVDEVMDVEYEFGEIEKNILTIGCWGPHSTETLVWTWRNMFTYMLKWRMELIVWEAKNIFVSMFFNLVF